MMNVSLIADYFLVLSSGIAVVGVRERTGFEQESSRTPKKNSQATHLPQSSRRRKGPAFLPSEHDELPLGVAFMASDFIVPIFSLLILFCRL